MRLAASNPDSHITGLEPTCTSGVYDADIAAVQLELNALSLTGIQANTPESLKFTHRSELHARMRQVELYYFIGNCFAGVRHLDRHVHAAARRHGGSRIGVSEARVAQAIAERVQRLTLEIAVSPALHCIALKWRQIRRRPIKC